MSTSYIFQIKYRDALNAVKALWLEEGVPAETVLEALKEVHSDLELYIAELEDEIERRREGTWEPVDETAPSLNGDHPPVAEPSPDASPEPSGEPSPEASLAPAPQPSGEPTS